MDRLRNTACGIDYKCRGAHFFQILCSWNGLMISGLALSGSGLGVKEYTEMAVKAARFIQTHLLQSEVKEPFFFSACTV